MCCCGSLCLLCALCAVHAHAFLGAFRAPQDVHLAHHACGMLPACLARCRERCNQNQEAQGEAGEAADGRIQVRPRLRMRWGVVVAVGWGVHSRATWLQRNLEAGRAAAIRRCGTIPGAAPHGGRSLVHSSRASFPRCPGCRAHQAEARRALAGMKIEVVRNTGQAFRRCGAASLASCMAVLSPPVVPTWAPPRPPAVPCLCSTCAHRSCAIRLLVGPARRAHAPCALPQAAPLCATSTWRTSPSQTAAPSS